jgi:hypothetical protein
MDLLTTDRVHLVVPYSYYFITHDELLFYKYIRKTIAAWIYYIQPENA